MPSAKESSSFYVDCNFYYKDGLINNHNIEDENLLDLYIFHINSPFHSTSNFNSRKKRKKKKPTFDTIKYHTQLMNSEMFLSGKIDNNASSNLQ
jgi:hypothetical protein